MNMKDVAQSTRLIDAADKMAEITPFTLCEDLWRLLGSYKSHMTRIAESFGLTMMQFGAMHAISDQEKGTATMGKVAQRLHCDASNATGIIDRLTALKFVVRQDNPNDRRVKSLVLTPLGNETLEKILEKMPSALGCDRLDETELHKMHRLVGKLTDI
jgi:MarR family transcriptional regulator, organic hydroperoxide resistance regulator